MSLNFAWLFVLFVVVLSRNAAAPDRSKEVEEDFNMFDLNKDKYIDAQEVIIGYRGDLPRLQVMEFFRDVDHNFDGLISFSEYLDFALSL
jgi:Ca2+-binding EF-hand superfamily protein